jgi:hypothetical protein
MAVTVLQRPPKWHTVYSQLGRPMNKNPKTAELTPSGLHDAVEPVLDGAATLEELPGGADHLLPIGFEIGGTERHARPSSRLAIQAHADSQPEKPASTTSPDSLSITAKRPGIVSTTR